MEYAFSIISILVLSIPLMYLLKRIGRVRYLIKDFYIPWIILFCLAVVFHYVELFSGNFTDILLFFWPVFIVITGVMFYFNEYKSTREAFQMINIGLLFGISRVYLYGFTGSESIFGFDNLFLTGIDTDSNILIISGIVMIVLFAIFVKQELNIREG